MAADLEKLAGDLEARAYMLRIQAQKLRNKGIEYFDEPTEKTAPVISSPILEGFDTFAEVLNRNLEETGVTRSKLARSVGLTQPYITQLTKGNRLPSLHAARLIALALGVPNGDEFIASVYKSRADRKSGITPKP